MLERLFRLVVGLAITSLVAGCAVKTTRVVETQKPAVFADGNTRKLEFAKVLFTIKDGTVIGKLHGGLACIPGAPSTWRGGNASVSEGRTVEKILSSLRRHGVQVTNNSDELFRTPDLHTDLTLGGKVSQLEFATCGEGTFTGRKGSATVSITWQVFSKSQAKVLLELTTEGSFSDDSFKPSNSATLFIDEAIGEATINLIAKPEFRTLLTLPASPAQGSRT
jgi:hypothetical protein